MTQKIFYLKIWTALQAIGRILQSPKYIAIAFVSGMIGLGAILWSLNIELLGFILFQAPLSVFEKIQFLLNIYGSIATNYANMQAFSMTLFSILFGLNIAVLTYVFRRGQRTVMKDTNSIGGMTFAVIGGGCAACGTAIIAPVVATFGAGSSSALVRDIGIGALFIGIVFIVYSLYGLGNRAATIQAEIKQRKVLR